MAMKSSVVVGWYNIMQSVKLNRCFGGTYHFHLQGWIVSHERMNRETSGVHEILNYEIIIINETIDSTHKNHNKSYNNVHVLNTIFSFKKRLVFRKIHYDKPKNDWTNTKWPNIIALFTFCFMLVLFWRWRRYAPPKRQSAYTVIYGIISQKTQLFTFTNPLATYIYPILLVPNTLFPVVIQLFVLIYLFNDASGSSGCIAPNGRMIIYLSIYLSIYLWLYSPLLGLGRFFSFLNLNTVGRTAWTGDQPVTRPLPTHRINAHTAIDVLSGMRTHDPSVRAGEDNSCLRPRGHCDRR
jgi:hypothetical protein